MQTEPANLKVENIDEFMRGLEQRRANDHTVVLDLQRMRIERPAASILSTALLSAWGEAPLVVYLPQEKEQLRKAALSTLAFAFANRRGHTQIDGAGDLSAWKRSWSPGTRNQVGLLFSPAQMGESDDEPSIFGRHHAAFINPHRSAPSPGPTTVTQVVRPWLTDVLPSYVSSSHDRRAHPQFIQDVGRLIDELLENVREHASGHTGGASTRSLVQVAITRGGDGSHDRLHVIVLDTGPGIAVTARPKLNEARLSDAELLRALLLGDLAGWHRARGAGLPKVWKAVSTWKGASLQIASNTVRVTGTGSKLAIRENGFHVQGTVIAAMFPLPAVALH